MSRWQQCTATCIPYWSFVVIRLYHIPMHWSYISSCYAPRMTPRCFYRIALPHILAIRKMTHHQKLQTDNSDLIEGILHNVIQLIVWTICESNIPMNRHECQNFKLRRKASIDDAKPVLLWSQILNVIGSESVYGLELVGEGASTKLPSSLV